MKRTLALIAALVPTLSFAAGLSTVVMGEKAKGLPRAAKAALEKDGSAVVGGDERHFFSVYDQNAYQGIPSFVTLDVVLHLFHLRFDELVATAERRTAAPRLAAFAAASTERALSAFPKTGAVDPRLKALALFHAVPLALLRPDDKPDPRVAGDVTVLLTAIRAGKGPFATSVCPQGLDTTRFKPRGHYTYGPLAQYFQAATFYSLCAFDLSTAEGLARALDVARATDSTARSHLKQVTALQAVVSGPGDDPGLEALAALVPEEAQTWPAALAPPASSALGERVRKTLVAGQVRDATARGPVFRVLGGSGVPDAALMSRTVDPAARAMPSALDVLAALGSADAAALLAPDVARFPALAEAVKASLATAGSGLYGRWLEVLGLTLRAPGADAPAFSRTAAWNRHLTVSAAASWAELRHDTLLYVKQPIVWAEGGDSAELPAAKAGGYVEPRPEVYAALGALLEEVTTLAGDEAKAQLAPLAELLTFLGEVSRLEVAGAPMPREADARLREIGSELEHLTRGHADALPPQALVADVFTGLLPTGGARVLYAAVGNADELWVVVPRGKKLLLTRGAVFSYYEFTRDSGERLSDRDWEFELGKAPAPERPEWARPAATRAAKPRNKD